MTISGNINQTLKIKLPILKREGWKKPITYQVTGSSGLTITHTPAGTSGPDSSFLNLTVTITPQASLGQNFIQVSGTPAPLATKQIVIDVGSPADYGWTYGVPVEVPLTYIPVENEPTTTETPRYTLSVSIEAEIPPPPAPGKHWIPMIIGPGGGGETALFVVSSILGHELPSALADATSRAKTQYSAKVSVDSWSPELGANPGDVYVDIIATYSISGGPPGNTNVGSGIL